MSEIEALKQGLIGSFHGAHVVYAPSTLPTKLNRAARRRAMRGKR